MGVSQSSCPVCSFPKGEDITPFSIRRPIGHPEGPVINPPNLQTMQDMAKSLFSRFPDRPYMGTRVKPDGTLAPEYTYKTYAECEAIAKNFGAGLAQKGIKKGGMFGIYSVNCQEWINSIDASSFYGFVIVSLYDSLCEDALSFLIKHSKMTVCMTSVKNSDRLFHIVANEERGQIHTIITIGETKDSANKSKIMNDYGIEITTFDEIVKLGEKNPIPLPKIDPEDPHFICYSSGTTGNPKGVIISHRATVSNCLAASQIFEPTPEDRYLSYLPLSHVFERAAVALISFAGGRISFISGDVKFLVPDMGIVKPTLFAAVPRVMNRFYEGVKKKLNDGGAIKRAIFWGAWYAKKWCICNRAPTGLLDAVAFNQINNLMGGCVRTFVVGGAAMDKGIHEFLQVATGIPIRSGYGLTEAGSGNVCNPKDIRCIKPGTVGGPLQNVEIRLEPIDGYDDPSAGEVQLSGQCLSSGYLYDEEATQKLFTDSTHKWIHTGDVGKFDKDNYLMIVDRMRSIFKLSQGEYVAAELVTQVYEEADLVQSIFVYGDSTRTCLVGIIVPEIGQVAKLLGKTKLTQEEFADACKNPMVKAEVKKQCDERAKAHNLFGYQYVRAIHLDPETWTIENQLLTPTFKLKRKSLADRFKNEIEQLYRELNRN